MSGYFNALFRKTGIHLNLNKELITKEAVALMKKSTKATALINSKKQIIILTFIMHFVPSVTVEYGKNPRLVQSVYGLHLCCPVHINTLNETSCRRLFNYGIFLFFILRSYNILLT